MEERKKKKSYVGILSSLQSTVFITIYLTLDIASHTYVERVDLLENVVDRSRNEAQFLFLLISIRKPD